MWSSIRTEDVRMDVSLSFMGLKDTKHKVR